MANWEDPAGSGCGKLNINILWILWLHLTVSLTVFLAINIDLSHVLFLPGMPLIRMSARAFKRPAYILCYWTKAVTSKPHRDDRITAAKANAPAVITGATRTMFFEVSVDLGKGFVHLAQKFKAQSMTVGVLSYDLWESKQHP